MANRRTPAVSPAQANPTIPAEAAAVRPPPRARTSPTLTPKPIQVSADARRGLIAESAFLRAERRGFAPGHENDDWLAAELEIDALLKISHGGSSQ
jgi:Protein of unknown function (DUF2934)